MLILNTGTQYVEGELSFDAGFQIFLYDTVFSQTGDYVLFDYSAGSFPGGQAQINNNVSVTAVDLKLSYLNPLGGITVLEDQPEHNRIIVKLLSKPNNGKQWVDGDLNFDGPTTLYLDQHLFTTPGTYELFEVTGVINGVENLTVIHDGGFLIGDPFVDPLDDKKVKITLVKAIGINSANISQAFAITPEIVQLKKYLRPTYTLTLCDVYNPIVESNISPSNTTVVSSVFEPKAIVKLSPSVATISDSNCFDPVVKQEIIVQNYSTVIASCENPVLENVTTPSLVTSTVFTPQAKQKIVLGFTSVLSDVFRLRTTTGESFWYDYFPMASFEGKILEDSVFRIFLLDSRGGFVSTHRYVSDIPGYEDGISQIINLNRTYINNLGDAIYEFDPVAFENLNFSFENAVIYANNILILHINWAIPFELNNQSITIKIPQTNALARPETNFGTLEFEGFIANPATVYARAYSPILPYLYLGTATVTARAIPLYNPEAILDTAFCSSYAFSPLFEETIDEIADPVLEIEMDDEFAYVEGFAFDTINIQNLNPETATVESFAFSPQGPSSQCFLESTVFVDCFAFSPDLYQEIKLDHTSVVSFVFNPFVEGNVDTETLVTLVSAYAPIAMVKLCPDFASVDAFALSPNPEQYIHLGYAFAQAASYDSYTEQDVGLQTATAFALSICPPVVYQEDIIIQPPVLPVVAEIKCADPFYEWKPKVSRISDLNPSKLEGYWTLDNHLRDESFNRRNLSFASLNPENNLSSYELGKIGQGFRGNSYLQDDIVYSDFLESNHAFNVGRKFSVQMWFKVDFDDILMDKNVSLIEQMNWCWNNGPAFPGSVGWSLHSSCDSETIQFQFNIVDGKSCIRTNANITLADGFQLSQKWHHVLFTKDDHQTFLYVDGAQYGSGEDEREILGEESEDHVYNVIDGISLKIGNSLTDYLRPLMTTNSADLVEGGVIPSESIVDDIAIWSKSLSRDEVARLWLEGEGNRADSLPHKRIGINTSEINQFRQGVELTHPLHYNTGLYKIYSGVRDTHRKYPGDFGNTKPVDSCKRAFVDIRAWNPIDYVTNYPEEYFVLGENPITDGVVKIISPDALKPEIMIGSLIGTNIKINELPNSAYIDNGYNNNETISIVPFIDDTIQIEGYNPSGYISQGNGFDHDASITRGIDSIAYGGLTY